jgi:putative transposase/transposase-like zinc-binding protein
MDPRPPLEVADVIRQHGDAFYTRHGPSLSFTQKRALLALARCRTAALGGHVDECDHCGARLITYNSCRNRHCPKCQAGRGAVWLEREAKSLLPVEYHHVVFTLPQAVAPLALQNPELVYGLLFRAAAQTLRQIAADPRHLGAEIGVVAVLHTWGQTLQHHPHLHCVASGGGLAVDAAGRRQQPARWRSCRPGFFLPVKVLGAVYRGKFLAGLRAAFAAGALQFHGRLAGLANPAAFQAWLQPLYAKPWVVYSKAPFAGPEVVLKYLARYTHRVALSNRRLVKLADGQVTFTWKDYAHGSKQRLMTLPAEEFLRRFFMHVLPKGFVKVRHYGLLANGQRQSKLALCRCLLVLAAVLLAALAQTRVTPAERRCPQCGVGCLHCVAELPGLSGQPGRVRVSTRYDTS